MNIRKKSLLLVVLFAALVPASLQAQVLGNNDLDMIFIVDREPSGGDALDIYMPGSNTVIDNALRFSGSNVEIDAITDSNTPGIAYALTSDGRVYEIDYNIGTTAQIANLTPPDNRTNYDSITNLPGSDELYILRTGGSNPKQIDTFNPITKNYATGQFEPAGGGAVDISDGPPVNASGITGSINTNGNPAIFVIATGGNFEAFDPAIPGSNVVFDNGDATYQGITNIAASTTQVALIRDGGASNSLTVQNIGNAKTNDAFVAPSGSTGFGITDVGPSNDDAVVLMDAGGALVVVDDVDGTPTQLAANAGEAGTNSYRDLTNASATPYNYIYVADDGGAEHIDAVNAIGLGNAGAQAARNNDNAYKSAPGGATDTEGGTFNDVSITDAQVADGMGGSDPFLFQLHTDGKLFQIDAVTGAETQVVDLNPTVAANRGTYDSITNIPGTTLLAILRTDRSTGSKHGSSGTLNDVVDLYDFSTDTYTEVVYTTLGGESIALTDGPSYNSVDGSFSTGSAIYIIGSDGSFEVYDPFNDVGLMAAISTGRPVGGNFIDITNVPGVDDSLYGYLDTSSGADRIYVLSLDGSVSLLAGVSGTGAIAITDTNDGGLMTVATGGANAYTTLTGSTTALATIPNNGAIASITNISPVPEPSSALALLTILTATLFGHRHRRKLSA